MDLTSVTNANELHPTKKLFVIGFPFGLTIMGGWSIWKTAHVASDQAVGYEHERAFLIDSTTRGGMSGAPVYAEFEKGQSDASFDDRAKFVGVYSGRLRRGTEVGIVWKTKTLEEILKAS